VFEIRVLRRIFEPKRAEVIEDWRILHNLEFQDLYSSPSKGCGRANACFSNNNNSVDFQVKQNLIT
jgi:hypothetical protein